MDRRKWVALWAGSLLGLSSVAMTAHAQQLPEQNRPQVYGSQLMTQQERNEYRARMRAARTQQERDQLRAEHHARMQARARERGVTLPGSPPPSGYGYGMGPGPGMGGMGPGPGMGGMGPGPGMGPGGGMGAGRP